MQTRIEITASGTMFHLDLKARHLYREKHVKIPLTKQQWNILEYFAKNPGIPLSKNDLIENVWGGQCVTDEAVTRAVSSLRKALGDDPDDPQFIETSFGFGYRFVAEVKALNEAVTDATGAPMESRHPEKAADLIGILRTKSGVDGFTKNISLPDDLEAIEVCIDPSFDRILIRNALTIIARLATGWDGRIIKRAESYAVVSDFYNRTTSRELKADAATTLASLQMHSSTKFLVDGLKAMDASVLAATLAVWADQIAYWDDISYWRKQVIAGLIEWISRPLESCLFIGRDGKEADCRSGVFAILGELNANEAVEAIEGYLIHGGGSVAVVIQAAAAHWRITKSERFLHLIEEEIYSHASTEAKRWIKEVSLSKIPSIVISEHTNQDESTEFIKGHFVRDDGFEFELYLNASPSHETYKHTRIVEMYIYAGGVIQWSWNAMDNQKPDWRYGRILLSDLVRGIQEMPSLKPTLTHPRT